jgi:L-threonylcarbamoyladenylate synthase
VADLITDDVGEAVRVLRAGGLVALPTETVYGLGADADNPQAVGRVYAVKGRPANHPVIVHLATTGDVHEWAVDVPAWADRLADGFWPGPLTLVLRRSDRAADHVTGGQDTIGLRVPEHPIMRAVLTGFGGTIAAPSANRFGRVSPTTAAHVLAELGDRLDPMTDKILDGGACRVGVESTIVDATSGFPRLLRPGAVTVEAIEQCIGLALLAPAAGVRAPGTLATHYAPHADVVLAEPTDVADVIARVLGARAGSVGLIALSDVPVDPTTPVVRLLAPTSAVDLARDLYAALRRADDLGLDVVVAVLPPDTEVGTAVRDRLLRAAAGRRGPESP